MSFNGVNNTIVVPHDNSLSRGYFTAEGWMYIDPGCPNVGAMLSKTTTSAHNDGYAIRFLTSGGYIDGFSHAFGTNVHYAASFNTWYHVVMTYDGITLRLYINGSEEDTRALTGKDPSTAALNLSYDSRFAGWIFKGAIDEVAIYGYPLNAAEVAAHYAAK